MRAARHASDEKRSAPEYKAEDGGVRARDRSSIGAVESPLRSMVHGVQR
jgi:hypothetical protein